MPRSRPGQVTLRDIAERAGVSAMTVSRALAGRDELVKADTARRIRRLAAEMGYVPNLMARSLRGEHIPTVVMFAEYISSHHYLAELVDQMSRAIETRKHGVISCQSTAALVQAVQQFNLAGAIVLAPPESFFYDEGGRPAPRLPIQTPTVIVHCAIEQSLYHEVSPDIVDMAFQAADHLLQLGHRHIGFLGGPAPELEPHWFTLRRKGITRALEARGLTSSRLYHQPCADAGLGEASLQQLLRRAPPVTGVICINDEIAVAAVCGARRMGMAVPADLSIVGSNDVRWAQFFSPRLTTIKIDIRGLVESGLDLFFDALHGRLIEHGPEPVRIALQAQLIPGETTAPPRRDADRR